MKKYRLLLLLPVIGLLILFFSLFRNVSEVKSSEQPNYHKVLFTKNSKLKHVGSEIKGNSSIISVYNYDSFQRGILVFRKKTSASSLKEMVDFLDKKSNIANGRFYKGSIFQEKLRYSFDETESVDRISIDIEGLDDGMIKINSDHLIYLRFHLKNLGVALNDEDNPVIFARSSRKEEINNLMLVLDDGYIYFVYSKPISTSANEIDLLEDLISKKYIENF